MNSPQINAIAAVSNNLVIGSEGKIPWHVPEDLKSFKRITENHPIIMGWNTWKSLKGPLPKRSHFVVTRNHQNEKNLEITICDSLIGAILIASRFYNQIFIIGGASIYEQSIAFVDRLYLTRVDVWVENGDAFFPKDWGKYFDHENVQCTKIPDPSINCDLLVYNKK